MVLVLLLFLPGRLQVRQAPLLRACNTKSNIITERTIKLYVIKVLINFLISRLHSCGKHSAVHICTSYSSAENFSKLIFYSFAWTVLCSRNEQTKTKDSVILGAKPQYFKHIAKTAIFSLCNIFVTAGDIDQTL